MKNDWIFYTWGIYWLIIAMGKFIFGWSEDKNIGVAIIGGFIFVVVYFIFKVIRLKKQEEILSEIDWV